MLTTCQSSEFQNGKAGTAQHKLCSSWPDSLLTGQGKNQGELKQREEGQQPNHRFETRADGMRAYAASGRMYFVQIYS